MEDQNSEAHKREFDANWVLNDGMETNLAPQPINIVIQSNYTGEELGRFYEKDGKLTFEGNVDEAGHRFVDFIVETFNERYRRELYNQQKKIK